MTQLRYSRYAKTLRRVPLLGLLLTGCATSSLHAQEDILFSYGDEDFISIATGRKQPISRAPSVASVVTAEQIKKMGAKDISEVLETIPGVHVSVKAGGYNPIFVFRGVYSEYNPQVLVLVDGTPITSLLFGDRGQDWGGLSVESISRIEVIRGPGSAIYGADAYAGTINIISKSPEEIKETQVGYSYGSYDEHRAWLTTAGEVAGWQTMLSLQTLNTNGQDQEIAADLQTTLDTIFGTDASQAPGELSLAKELYEIYLNATKQNWQINLNYAELNNAGIGVGASNSLDQIGEGNGNRFTARLSHTYANFLPDTEMKSSLSYQRLRNDLDLVLFPPGFDYSSVGGFSFPDGVLGQPDTSEEHIRLDLSWFYSGIDKHDITIGTGYHYHDQYRVEEKKNYSLVLTPSGPLPAPLGGLIDVSDTAPFNQEEIREVTYLYLQDVWRLAPDWSLTAGLRYDNYSDFGDTFNPRLALVWQTSYALTTKLLYGRAFRAPSFAELFNLNNPVAIGNPELDPETINTYELAFSYNASADLTMGLNFFYYKMEDIIRFDPYVADNTGDQDGHGIEFEVDWTPHSKLHVIANYAWQSSEDQRTDETAPYAPEHQLYLQGDYEFLPGWYANVQINHVMDRERDVGDNRDPIDDYTQTNLILRATQLIPSWEFAAGIKNLTDEDIDEPSLAPGYIPDDLPQAGRHYFAEIRKSF